MSIQYIKGVGPKRASKLKKLNIHTIEDLLYFVPREYEDRTNFKYIAQCKEGEKASLKVRICGYPTKLRPRKSLNILKIPVQDETGMAYLVWFNQNYVLKQLSLGDIIVVYGKINRFGNEIQITNPVFEKGKGNK